MTRLPTLHLVILGLLAFACELPAQTIGPKGDRYELRVAKTKPEVYAAALSVLTDSSFQAKEASLDGGLIRTDWRKPGDVAKKGLGGFLRAQLQDPMRLLLIIIPIGADSTRVTITGESNAEQIDRTMRIDQRMKPEWRILRGVGDAILEALK